MNSKKNNWKLVRPSMGVGLGALGAMVVLGLAAPGVSAGSEDPTEPAPVTTGETVTETIPPTSPETSVATPTVSATTPSGFATPH